MCCLYMHCTGSTPPLHFSSADFLYMRVHARCCAADAAAVEAHARSILEAAGRDPNSIAIADVKHFCKHARYLRWMPVLLWQAAGECVLPQLASSSGVCSRSAPTPGVLCATNAAHRSLDFEGAAETDMSADLLPACPFPPLPGWCAGGRWQKRQRQAAAAARRCAALCRQRTQPTMQRCMCCCGRRTASTRHTSATRGRMTSEWRWGVQSCVRMKHVRWAIEGKPTCGGRQGWLQCK